MLQFNTEEMKSIQSLQMNVQFIKLVKKLEVEYNTSLQGLLAAPPDKVGQLQGRVKILTEMLDVFKQQ